MLSYVKSWKLNLNSSQNHISVLLDAETKIMLRTTTNFEAQNSLTSKFRLSAEYNALTETTF